MRVGEYGIVFYLNTRLDISAFTSLSLAFTKPDNTTLTKTNPDVAIGDTDVVTSLGTFLANQYVTYTFQDGDVELFGEWMAQLTVNDGTRNLITAATTFAVDE